MLALSVAAGAKLDALSEFPSKTHHKFSARRAVRHRNDKGQRTKDITSSKAKPPASVKAAGVAGDPPSRPLRFMDRCEERSFRSVLRTLSVCMYVGIWGRLDACFLQQAQAARYEESNSLPLSYSWA